MLGSRIVSPISNLSKAIGAMQPQSIVQKVPVTSTDELGQLSPSFNQMTEDIASFVDVIQRQKEKIIETEALRKYFS